MLTRYLLKTLALPPASNLILIIIGLCLWRSFPRFARVCVISGVLSLWLLSTPWFSAKLIAPLENAYPTLSAGSRCGDAQAVVVLGGGLRLESPEFEGGITLKPRSLNRTRYAALIAEKCALPLLVSGGKTFDRQGKAEAEVMRDLVAQWSPQTEVWVEQKSRNTAENAEASAAILRGKNISKIILVTSAYHIPRSMSAFRAQDLDPTAAPTDFSNVAKRSVLNWLPDADALVYSERALHEYLGLVVYQVERFI
ncbi:MAG: YdcF family protein [Pseudomonadota bacterium]